MSDTETRNDGYLNMLNKAGTAQDNSTHYQYANTEWTSDMELASLYESNGLFAKIIDRPSEEAIKHGLDIDYGDDDILELVDEKIDELEVMEAFAQAEKWARLFGGAIIVMIVADGGKLDTPLNMKKAKGLVELRVFERAVVQPDYNSYLYNSIDNTSKYRPMGEPEVYTVSSIYGTFNVHRSRCLIFKNGNMPEYSMMEDYRYWGVPLYNRIKRAMRECITSHEDGVKLLERSVQAIYKMKDLARLLETEQGENMVLTRLQVIDMARNIINSIAIDSEGEDYDFKTAPATGVKDVVDSTCNMLSAVTDIPQTILFGRSPAGENSTGESDFENYYNMVENIQKTNMKKNLRIVIDLILQQLKIDGKIDKIPPYKVKFAPLWSTSDMDQANIDSIKAGIEKTKADTINVYVAMGALDPSEVRAKLAKSEDFEIVDIIDESADLDIQPEDLELEEPEEETPTKTDSRYDAADTNKGCGVLIINKGKVLVGKRTDNGKLCGPGGHIQECETPEEGAIRECKEEFGITPLSIKKFGQSYTSTYFWTDKFEGTPKTDKVEMTNGKWMSLEDLSKEELHPAFEDSINKFVNLLTNEDGKVIVKSNNNDNNPYRDEYGRFCSEEQAASGMKEGVSYMPGTELGDKNLEVIKKIVEDKKKRKPGYPLYDVKESERKPRLIDKSLNISEKEAAMVCSKIDSAAHLANSTNGTIKVRNDIYGFSRTKNGDAYIVWKKGIK